MFSSSEEMMLDHLGCALQGREGDGDQDQHGSKIVVREDPPGDSRDRGGEVEEEEGVVVERVESGKASHRDSGAGEYTLLPFPFSVARVQVQGL